MKSIAIASQKAWFRPQIRPSIRPTYRQYERRKLGGRAESAAGIAHMLRQSFFATSFAGFWRNWNPLFSYYLLYYSYRPLQKRLPRPWALLGTFLLSGAVHDLAATLLLQRGVFLFAPAFGLFALWVILEAWLGISLKPLPPGLRPLYHLALIAGSFFLVNMLFASQ